MKKVSKRRKAILDAPITAEEERAVGWDKVMEDLCKKLNRNKKKGATGTARQADIATLRESFRSMEPMREEDELEDLTLTDHERDTKRFRERVRTNQWVKIVTDHHSSWPSMERRSWSRIGFDQTSSYKSSRDRANGFSSCSVIAAWGGVG